jgi:hypothetical protein
LLGHSALEDRVGEDEAPQLQEHLFVFLILLVVGNVAQLLQLPESGALVEVELLLEVLVLDRRDLLLQSYV